MMSDVLKNVMLELSNEIATNISNVGNEYERSNSLFRSLATINVVDDE